MTNDFETHSAVETLDLGKAFADLLRPGDVVALHGELGSGKTQFVKGVCLGLEIRDCVTSPSFTIVNEYPKGKYPVYHFDFYRLRSLAELNEIGFDEYLFGGGVCLLEWADAVGDRLPSNRYDVTLTLGRDYNQRLIQIKKTATE